MHAIALWLSEGGALVTHEESFATWDPRGREAMRMALEKAKAHAAEAAHDDRCRLCGASGEQVRAEWEQWGAHTCVRRGGR